MAFLSSGKRGCANEGVDTTLKSLNVIFFFFFEPEANEHAGLVNWFKAT